FRSEIRALAGQSSGWRDGTGSLLPHRYDETVRRGGLIFAVAAFLVGLAILFSKRRGAKGRGAREVMEEMRLSRA
uniref:FXYD domain-containing ion transport regulator n=1 Tax=Laticauda laticaudata TaxID=8630 RepID=A0A8C5SGG2_LATLA